MKRKSYAEAIETCIEALRVHPEDLRARVILGVSYMRTGKLDRAESELLKAREMLGISSDVYISLAELYDQKGNAQQAARYRKLFETFRSANEFLSRTEPSQPAAEKLGADLESKSEGVSEIEPEVTTITMAELYVQQGHLEKAAVVYRKILETAPETSGIEEKIAELEKKISDSRSRPSLLHVLESWRHQLRERIAAQTALSPLESLNLEPDNLAAFIQKHFKKMSSS